MHFNTISGRHGGVPYSGVEIRHRTHTLKEFLFIHFESSFHFDQELLKKADLGFTVQYLHCASQLLSIGIPRFKLLMWLHKRKTGEAKTT